MTTPLPLGLALQGGDAHGALTWGVLDWLLESQYFAPTALTGTSAGAVNAAACAIGWAQDCADGARKALRRVWTAVSSSGPSGWMTTGSAEAPALSTPARAAMRMTRSLSPYQLNPFGVDPLRAVDSVLASACLPTIQQAVVIDDEPYWDGGYSANPPLLPLLDFAPDALVVLICGMTYDSAPRTSAQIRAREAEFAFTASFQREAECLAAATAKAADTDPASRGRLEERLTRMRWHALNVRPTLSRLSSESRMINHRPSLDSLFDKGRELASQRFQETHNALGRRSSADLAALDLAAVDLADGDLT